MPDDAAHDAALFDDPLCIALRHGDRLTGVLVCGDAGTPGFAELSAYELFGQMAAMTLSLRGA